MRVTKVGNLTEPLRYIDRERRPLKGLETLYEITRTGVLWSVEAECFLEPQSFPRAVLLVGDRLVEININEAVALAWLTPEQRQSIRERFPSPQNRPWSAEFLALEADLQVSIYALAAVTHTRSDEEFAYFEALAETPLPPDRGQVVDAKVDAYGTYLAEHYRPPSKGGNTRALHRHVLTIGNVRYSFLALGSRKWVFKDDTVSFEYVTTPEGYRNVLKSTLITKDKDGKPVVRGDRGFKPKLRSAPPRMPASRRERRN